MLQQQDISEAENLLEQDLLARQENDQLMKEQHL